MSLTPDGRLLVFAASWSLRPEGHVAQIMQFDRDTKIVQVVDLTGDSDSPNGECWHPTVSADGRIIAFESVATNLVPGKGKGVYVRNTLQRTTEYVGEGSLPVVSGNGRFVAFVSYSSALVPADTNGAPDVFLFDRQTGRTSRVNVSSEGEQAGWSPADKRPAISADGRFIAFESWAGNLVPDDSNGHPDIFVRDTLLGTTERVSVSATGGQGSLPSMGPPAISADGRFVAFDSWSTFVAGDINNEGDLFVKDRSTGGIERVSVSSSGAGAEGDSYGTHPVLSADGRHVLFYSDAAGLVPGDSNGCGDLFLHDCLTGVTERVDVWNQDGEWQYGIDRNSPFAISADGRYAAFANGARLYIRDRAAPAVPLSDIAASPYRSAIEAMAQDGIISGYGDGRFGPDDPVVRAQFAKIAVRSLDLEVTERGAPLPFTDVETPADNLYPDDYVAVAAANGLIQGYGDGLFGPYDDIVRAQLLTIVVRAAERFKPGAVRTPPSGWSGALPGSDPTHGANIRLAEYSGLLAGIDLSGFFIWGPATRGEVAQILWNLREKQ